VQYSTSKTRDCHNDRVDWVERIPNDTPGGGVRKHFLVALHQDGPMQEHPQQKYRHVGRRESCHTTDAVGDGEMGVGLQFLQTREPGEGGARDARDGVVE
jgi:hypothetical protein